MASTDINDIQKLFAEHEELTKIYKTNFTIQDEFQKRIDEIKMKIIDESNAYEIAKIEFEEEENYSKRLGCLFSVKSDECEKMKECEEEVEVINERIKKKDDLQRECYSGLEALKEEVMDIESYVNEMEALALPKSTKSQCIELEKEINNCNDMIKEKKNELMALTSEYLHPTNWEKSLIKLVVLRKKKLLQQCGIKVIQRNNQKLMNETITEGKALKIQKATEKIIGDLKNFDKMFGINKFSSFFE